MVTSFQDGLRERVQALEGPETSIFAKKNVPLFSFGLSIYSEALALTR
jgi:hypothetical protein